MKKTKKIVCLTPLLLPLFLTAAPIQAAQLPEGSAIQKQTENPKVPEPIQIIDLDKELLDGQEYKVKNELVFDNPFGNKELAESLREIGVYDTPKTRPEKWALQSWSRKPVWEKGLTVSYWIKVPSEEDGGYSRGSALRWELDEKLSYNADDYARYLTCSYWDVERKNIAKEQYNGSMAALNATAAGEESKTVYGSQFYFKYAETTGETDEDGAPLPRLHRSESGFEGPVYDARYIRDTDGYFYSDYYNYNPNYVRGFVKLADGSYEEQNPGSQDARYESYHMLDMESGSIVRRAYVDGQLQIDTDNSIFWNPECAHGPQLNKNVTPYEENFVMQRANNFYANSWWDSSEKDEDGYGTYASAKDRALSPVTAVSGDGISVPGGNADRWHQVTVTFQNDWVEFYVDGVCADVRETYAAKGGLWLNFYSKPQFNKGCSLRWIPTEQVCMSLDHPNFNCTLLMDWITDENATLHIGGAGKYGKMHGLADTAGEFYMDDLYFYGELLNEEQIQSAYYEQAVSRGLLEEKKKPGDVNFDGTVNLTDAQQVLKMALNLLPFTDEEKEAADVDGDKKITLADAQLVLKAALNLISLEQK